MPEAGAVVMLMAVGLYLGAGLLLYGFQSRLIHLPNVPQRELTTTPDAISLPWENVWLDTADGVRIHGWYLPSRHERPLTLIFLHGNAGNIGLRLDSLEIFHELGLATLIIDYRGYGRSEGEPSEAGLYRDADAAWRHLVEERGTAPEDIVVFGRSLGAAVAAHLAAERPVAGLIVESAFTSVPDRAAELYPIFPVRLLTRIHYPTRSLVQKVTAPVLVVHSTQDEVIPFDHGQAIYAAANEPKQFLRLSGGHNEGFLLNRDAYRQGLEDWLRRIR